jgi:peptidylprolyl isomerase
VRARGATIAAAIAALAAACGPRSTPPAAAVIANTPAPPDAGPPPRPALPSPGPTAIELGGGVFVEMLAVGEDDLAPPLANDRVTVQVRDLGSDLAPRQVVQAVHDLPAGIGAAVSLMRPGAQARVWLPTVEPEGGPADPLVFDVELDANIVRAPPVPGDLGVPPATATRLPSGVAYVVLVPGTGPRAGVNDTLTLHITHWEPSGIMESHTARDYPSGITANRDTSGRGLGEALGTMSAGQRSRFWIPGELVDEDPDVTFTYEVELLAIRVKQPPPPVPKDVARPPRGAKRTAAGVSYRFLARAKKNGARPTATSRVRVHYSGWTTDGKPFDSSVTRGAPSDFPLGAVIPGWTDVLQVMTPGDRIRAWIPEALAYKGLAGRPQGMLVFDIELIEILP